MKYHWVLYVAQRYFRTKRKNRGLAPSVLSVAGIAVGVMALVSVLGVMNGFQLGFINDILSIGSYHLRISDPAGSLSPQDLEKLRSLPGIQAALPFREVQTMVTSGAAGFVATAVRGIPDNAAAVDPDLAAHLHVMAGTLTFGNDRSIVVGDELAQILGVRVGDMLSVISLSGGSFAALRPESIAFRVVGIFKSGYYEYDRSLCFVSLPAAVDLGSAPGDIVYGVKLHDRFRDAPAVRRIEAAFPGLNLKVESWRSFNSAFFGALRMEKLVMVILLGLIFLVVAVNIFHFLRRTVFERREEIGILRSLGASPPAVQAVFVFDGLYIGVVGGVIGLVLGLLISDHINAIFTGVALVINAALSAVGALFIPFAGADSFSVFSPASFYLDAIPSKVLFHEAALIFLFGIVAAVGAAYLASRSAAKVKPQEVLRYE